uniref:Putative Thiamine monophosphate synthase n=1 Tax=Magnetococcus massalia (strain MO-1) TaxID=451514 RepID=A0A1S7LLM2_MAGMO|nr:putative Thiamine monophosphate synthase [Candidatus Magnetococcus massalia]
MAITVPPLLLITDQQVCPDLNSWLPAALAGGATHLLLRAKGLEDAAYMAQAEELKAILHAAGGSLIVHDRPHLVALLNACGVHMADGQEDLAIIRQRLGAESWLSSSCHDLAGAKRAFAAGVDAVTLSPLFATASHPEAPALGCATFAQWVAELPGPVFALGGVTVENAPQAKTAGAAGVALIRGVCAAEDPTAVCQSLRKLFRPPV